MLHESGDGGGIPKSRRPAASAAMRGVYSHVTPAMQQRLTAALQHRWESTQLLRFLMPTTSRWPPFSRSAVGRRWRCARRRGCDGGRDHVRAVWYERQGPAAEVLQVGELVDPRPGPQEVRVRLTRSGVNPGDTKKRRGWLGSTMPYPRVIPHSDGAGVIDSVGPGVDPSRVGARVWVFGAQSYRPFGTAAELTVVPSGQAVDLLHGVSDEVGACLGIPGITAHRAVFADGPVAGLTVLVHGVLGGVGALAAQLSRWGGATVIGTVRRSDDLPQATASGVTRAVALDQPDVADAIRAHAPDGVDRIIEVAFSDNVDLDAAVARNQTVIAAYATGRDRPDFPFWPMLFDNITVRLLGSDDFPAEAKQQAATDLTAAAQDGALSIQIGTALPLEQTAQAHDRVDTGTRARVLLAVRD
jgi:NADPH:quinone reductase